MGQGPGRVVEGRRVREGPPEGLKLSEHVCTHRDGTTKVTSRHLDFIINRVEVGAPGRKGMQLVISGS